MKAIANTTIRLGLINLPVQVCAATESGKDISFNQAGPNGEKLRQAYLLPDGSECKKDDMQKGLFEGGEFFPIDTDQIDNIKEQTKLRDLNCDVVSAEEFWKRAHRITGLYYIQMNQKTGSAASMKLFVDALERQGKVLTTKWTPRSRQQQMVLWPKDGILYANSLAFDGDVREPDDAVRAHLEGSYTEAEMQMATQLLDALADTKANMLDMEVDEAGPLRDKLVQDALAGVPIDAPAEQAQQAKNVALADALAAALAASSPGEKAKAAA